MPLRFAFVIAVFVGLLSTAAAEELFSMRQINESTGRFRPRVIGGQLALRKDWPSTLRFQTLIANRLINCTSTIIGNRTIITAAHCIAKNGARGGAFIGSEVFNLTCSSHPEFRGAGPCLMARSPNQLSGCAADVAICKSDRPIPDSIGSFETIEAKADAIQENAGLVLLGFGCTKANGPISDTLQVGQARVIQIGRIGAPQAIGEYTIATGGSAICPGDSGGSSFNSADQKSRKVVAINSRGNLTSNSYLVNISDQSIVEFLRKWRSTEQVKICGLDQDANNCRH